MKHMKKSLSLLLSLVMIASCLALYANAYSFIPGSSALLVKAGDLAGMIDVYKAERYGDNGNNRFSKMKSVSITAKGTTNAELLGDMTYVKFHKTGKAVVKTVAQVFDVKKNAYYDDTYSFTFYVASGTNYVVAFEPNGGDGNVNVYSGSKTILKGDQPHQSRTGYTFTGWATTVGGPVDYSTNVTAFEKAPMILYAQWKPNTYTLSFNANGGSVSPTSKSVTYGGTFGDLPTPTRAGYKFDGWYGSATGGGQFVSSSPYSFTQNLTIYAHWTKLTEISKIEITGITAPVVGEKPVTTGYKISSNITVKSCNWTENLYGDTYSVTSDTTFQSGKKYAISFEVKPADGYAFAAGSKMTATVDGKTALFSNPNVGVYYIRYVYGAPATKVSSVMITGVSEPSYGAAISTSGVKASAGFTITDSYWSKKNSSGIYSKTTDTAFQRDGEYSLYISGKIASGYVAADTLSAMIGGKKATVQKNGGNYSISYRYDKVTQNVWVTFDANGGTLTDAEKTKIVTVGSVYNALPTPTKTGYSFDGWYDGSTKITSASKVTKTANHTLTALWKAKTPTTVTVTFDPNGGTVSASEKTKTVTVGNAYGQLPVPTRSGYTFEGWFNAANNQITAATNVTVSSNHTLTAKWKALEAKTVTVTFDATPGLVETHTKTVTVGEKYGTLPIASRGGYKFLGWYDDTDALTTSVSVVNKSTDHTLKAKWESLAAKVTVTFDPNGGSVMPMAMSVEPGKLYGTLPTPIRSGFTFLGWYSKDSVKITNDTVVPYSVDHTLTAKWVENTAAPVTVSLDPGDGSVDDGSKTLEPGKPFGELPTPTRPGFVFLGWFDKDGNKISATDLVPPGNFTLTAKWEAETAPHTEHVYDEGKVTKAATCTATGEKTFTCTVCGATKTEVIPMAEHTYSEKAVTRQASCTATGEQSFTCSVCGGSYVEVIPKLSHDFKTVTTPATLKTSGEVVNTCSLCGETVVQRVIYRPKTFTLSAKKFTYNGKAKKPSVTVTDAKGEIVDPESYKVTYSGNKQIGTAKVKIVFRGEYSGTKTLKFKILPKKTVIKKLTAGSKAFKAVWKEIKTADGYQLQYATNKSFSKAKTLKINDATVTAKTVKKLLAEKIYYIRIRTVKIVGTTTYASAWSKIYKVKTK